MAEEQRNRKEELGLGAGTPVAGAGPRGVTAPLPLGGRQRPLPADGPPWVMPGRAEGSGPPGLEGHFSCLSRL